MKKTLAILLALLMLASVALVACDGGGRQPVDDNWDDEENENVDGSDESTDESSSESESESESGSGNNNTNVTGWIDKSDTVYAGVNGLRLRTSTSTSTNNNVGRQVDNGTALSRLATNGTWDKVKVSGDDTEYYVLSKYICTTANNFSFTNVTGDVTITLVEGEGNVCFYTSPFHVYDGGSIAYDNIYASSGFDKQISGTIKKLATTPNGWVKVEVAGEFKVAGTASTTKTIAEGTILYLDPSTAESSRINDPSRPAGGGNGGGLG